jgi:hypothetical protein
MSMIDEVPARNRLRGRATSELGDIDPELTTRQFFEKHFPDVLEKGQDAAEKMAQILEGQVVRRSYFMPSFDTTDRPPVYIQVTKVTAEEAGIVRVYDARGAVRDFPALVFTFFYRQDGRAVICVSEEYTVLLELVS